MFNKNKKNDDDFPDERDLVEDKEEELDDEKKNNETIVVPKSKMILVKKLLANIKENNDRLMQVLSGFITDEDELSINISQLSDDNFSEDSELAGETKVIEGVFDGENMIGPDGKQYSVPANYASKSKLVEGDILKLTITGKGTFVYKQIGPIERARVVAKLEKTADNEFIAIADGKKWRLLTASVTYFRGEATDEAVILVPKNGESKWAAVENIVKKG